MEGGFSGRRSEDPLQHFKHSWRPLAKDQKTPPMWNQEFPRGWEISKTGGHLATDQKTPFNTSELAGVLWPKIRRLHLELNLVFPCGYGEFQKEWVL